MMNYTEWEEFPSYLELFQAAKKFLVGYFQKKDSNCVDGSQFVYNYSLVDVIFVIFFTIGWTCLRQITSDRILKPLGRQYALTTSNQSKMPESAWKFLYFLASWCINYYILILSGDYKFIQKPSTIWTGWSLHQTPPTKIYFFYVAQCGFYIHSIYATIYMDAWRKDSVPMLIHHGCALMLTVLSFGLRYHNIGCMVIFVHDICDVFLEFSKLNVYFKIQRGKLVMMHEIIANISFLSFTIVWCIFRLYWFPLRVLYAGISDINGLHLYDVLPYSLFMNSLGWMLQILDIYWFTLILQTLYRVATGQLIEDRREYDVDEKFKQKQM